jgi:hypothetical protein
VSQTFCLTRSNIHIRALGTGKIEYNDTEVQFHKYKVRINKDQTIVLLCGAWGGVVAKALRY